MKIRNRKLRRYLDHARNKFRVPPEIVDAIAEAQQGHGGGKRGAKGAIRQFREARARTGIAI